MREQQPISNRHEMAAEHRLDQPGCAEKEEDHRQAKSKSRGPRLPVDPPPQRSQRADDYELPRFDAEVEGYERSRQAASRQAELAQHAGKAKAMHEAEPEGQHPTMPGARYP